MKSRLFLAVAAMLALGLAAAPAEAAKRKPTKLTVAKRSYLTAGTTVYPGSQNYHDYIIMPNTTALSAIDPSGSSRGPLPGPFDLPGARPLAVDFGR